MTFVGNYIVGASIAIVPNVNENAKIMLLCHLKKDAAIWFRVPLEKGECRRFDLDPNGREALTTFHEDVVGTIISRRQRCRPSAPCQFSKDEKLPGISCKRAANIPAH
jgi:hypothetical protein